jgi:hypothetical protein
LRGPDLARRHLPVFHHPGLQPFADQPRDPTISDTVLDEADQPLVPDAVEERLDIGIHDPVHLLALDRHRHCVQRSMLAAPRPEPVAEPEEVFLIDGIQHLGHGPLDDLVLQRRYAERP